MSEAQGRPDSAAEVQQVREQAEAFGRMFCALEEEIGKVIVGHREVRLGVLYALFAGGHALLEGVPGLGKTLLVRTLAEALSLPFSRIQFTPDLMPADITGATIVVEDPQTGGRRFEFQKGPIFAQLILADEINRATPKTQSALLEAMQERSVTAGGATHRLEAPFFVLATQNPIEQEGTYPLPEAQLDRFLFKIDVGYPDLDDLLTVLDRTTGAQAPTASAVLDGQAVLAAQALVRRVQAAPHVKEHAARLTLATHPQGRFAPPIVNRCVRVGASPRAAQALLLGGKARALSQGRLHVSIEDLRELAPMALRHRLALNFEAEADGVTPDEIVRSVVETTALPAQEAT